MSKELLTTDLAATLAGLRGRGVDLDIDGAPFPTEERGIADAASILITWFRDPDDPVLSILRPT